MVLAQDATDVWETTVRHGCDQLEQDQHCSHQEPSFQLLVGEQGELLECYCQLLPVPC